MNTSDFFGPVLIGGLIYIVLMYLVINAAVKSANHKQEDLLRTQNRLLLKLLNEKGISHEDLFKLYTESDEQFWGGLKRKQIQS